MGDPPGTPIVVNCCLCNKPASTESLLEIVGLSTAAVATKKKFCQNIVKTKKLRFFCDDCENTDFETTKTDSAENIDSKISALEKRLFDSLPTMISDQISSKLLGDVPSPPAQASGSGTRTSASYTKVASGSLIDRVCTTVRADFRKELDTKEREAVNKRTVIMQGLEYESYDSDRTVLLAILAEFNLDGSSLDRHTRLPQRSDGKPPLLKVVFQSESACKHVLASKFNLRDIEDFSAIHIRPSLPFETCVERNHLILIANKWNAASSDASDYVVVFNSRNEKYEIHRKIDVDGETRIDWSKAFTPNTVECSTAAKEWETEWKKTKQGTANVPENSR